MEERSGYDADVARRARLKTASLVVLVLGCIACACCGGIGFLAMRDQRALAPLSSACEGRAVAAAAVVDGVRPTRLVYFERSASSWVASAVEVPTVLRAEGVTDATHVACADDEAVRTVVGQCCFQRSVLGIEVPGAPLCMPQARRARRVEVRLAASGALVATQRIAGPEPKVCSDWVGRRPSASQFEAAEPDADAYASFLTAAVRGEPLPQEVVIVPMERAPDALGVEPSDAPAHKRP